MEPGLSTGEHNLSSVQSHNKGFSLALDVETVFLLKLASGRRRNKLHALSCDEKCYCFRANGGLVTLITKPGFLAKNKKHQTMPRIVIPALGPLEGDHPDRKLCTVRALKAYLDRTKKSEAHRGWTRLFLNPKKPGSNISSAHISTWIKRLAQDAHEHVGVQHLRLVKVSARDVWKFSASWAAFKQHTGKAGLPLPALISKQWLLKPNSHSVPRRFFRWGGGSSRCCSSPSVQGLKPPTLANSLWSEVSVSVGSSRSRSVSFPSVAVIPILQIEFEFGMLKVLA